MADTANGNDVSIKVGAEADIDPAAKKIYDEFGRIGEMLQKVATEDAKELVEEIQAVQNAMRAGAFNPKDVEAIADEFAKIKDYSQISDKKIENLSQKLKNSKESSRGLADAVGKFRNGSTRTERVFGKIKEHLVNTSPAANKVSDAFGKLAWKVPGIGKAMAAWPKLAAVAGAAILGVVAAAAKLVGMIGATNEKIRGIRDRERGIDEMEGARAYQNKVAELTEAERRRAEVYASGKARTEIENATSILERRTEYKKKRMNDPAWLSENKEYLDQYFERGISKQEHLDKVKMIEDDIKESNEVGKAIDEQIKAEEENIDRLKKEKEISDKYMAAYDEIRSKREKQLDEEARKQLKDKGVFEGAAGFDEMLKKMKDELFSSDTWRARFADIEGSVLSMFGINSASPEEAGKLFQQERQKSLAKRQEITQAEQRKTALQNQKDAVGDSTRNLEAQKAKEEAEEKVRQQEFDFQNEERKRNAEISLMGKRTEMMGQKNRLTALGLGGGNVGADYGKDIAGTTRRILGVLERGLLGASSAKNPLVGGDIHGMSGLFNPARRRNTTVWGQ